MKSILLASAFIAAVVLIIVGGAYFFTIKPAVEIATRLANDDTVEARVRSCPGYSQCFYSDDKVVAVWKNDAKGHATKAGYVHLPKDEFGGWERADIHWTTLEPQQAVVAAAAKASGKLETLMRVRPLYCPSRQCSGNDAIIAEIRGRVLGGAEITGVAHFASLDDKTPKLVWNEYVPQPTPLLGAP